MKETTGIVIFAMALGLAGCASFRHHKGGCCGESCSMEKHDATHKESCCKDGKCDMPEKKADEKK